MTPETTMRGGWVVTPTTAPESPLSPQATTVSATDDSALEDGSAELSAVFEWSSDYLVGIAPAFGSREWCALDPDDPLRWAAVVRAALAWWRVGDPYAAVEQRFEAYLMVESSHAVSAADDWALIALAPSFAELSARRDWERNRRPALRNAG